MGREGPGHGRGTGQGGRARAWRWAGREGAVVPGEEPGGPECGTGGMWVVRVREMRSQVGDFGVGSVGRLGVWACVVADGGLAVDGRNSGSLDLRLDTINRFVGPI